MNTFPLSRNKVAVPEGAAGTPPFWSAPRGTAASAAGQQDGAETETRFRRTVAQKSSRRGRGRQSADEPSAARSLKQAKAKYRLWHGITPRGVRGGRRGISSVGLEHLLCTQGVIGSSPLFSTKKEGH